MRPRTILLITLVAATAVFCIVQDRLTARGAGQYVEMQRAAAASTAKPVAMDHVMRPAVRRSVQEATAWSLAVVLAGAATARALRSRRGGNA